MQRHRQPVGVAEIGTDVSLLPLITAGFAAALTLVATPAGAPTANDIKVLLSQTSVKATSGRKGQFRSPHTAHVEDGGEA